MDKEKIVASFGLDFYEKVRSDLEKYSELWRLSDFEEIDNYTWSCTFKCVSDKHGLCVLKIAESPISAERECCVLNEYNGRGFCKLHEADTTNGVFLVERIVPGTPLSDEPDFDRQIDILCEFWFGLHIEPGNKNKYASYMTWVNNITEQMSTRNDCKELYIHMVKAQEICTRLYEAYPIEVCLHNDLGHGSDNLLLDSNLGCYRAIDPREPVVGPALFDFVFAIGYGNVKTDLYITNTMSKKLNIPERDLWRAIYVSICREICVQVKYGGEPNIGLILQIEKLMDEMSQ
jgi:streptomycin 6-kinase